MTPRERLLTCLRGEAPDRVGVTAYEFSHLDDRRPRNDPGYAALIDLQRREGESFVHWGVDFGTGVGDPNVVVDGGADPACGQERRLTLPTPKGELTSVSRREPGNITWWRVKPLIADADDCRRWLSLPDRPAAPDLDAVRRVQDRLGEEGLVVLGPGDALGIVCGMFHFSDFAMVLTDDEPLILEMLARMAARLNDGLRKVCAGVSGVCVRFWGPEYAGAPLLDPRRYFPKLVVDFDREAFEIVNASGNFSVLHCHGRLNDITDGIAELAPAALEPLEVLPASTADISMAELKRRLGRRTCLMGGVQAAELEGLTPERLDARLQEVIEAGAPGGGFVLLPTSAPIEHPLSRRVLENYRVYFRAAAKYGGYG